MCHPVNLEGDKMALLTELRIGLEEDIFSRGHHNQRGRA